MKGGFVRPRVTHTPCADGRVRRVVVAAKKSSPAASHGRKPSTDVSNESAWSTVDGTRAAIDLHCVVWAAGRGHSPGLNYQDTDDARA